MSFPEPLEASHQIRDGDGARSSMMAMNARSTFLQHVALKLLGNFIERLFPAGRADDNPAPVGLRVAVRFAGGRQSSKISFEKCPASIHGGSYVPKGVTAMDFFSTSPTAAASGADSSASPALRLVATLCDERSAVDSGASESGTTEPSSRVARVAWRALSSARRRYNAAGDD